MSAASPAGVVVERGLAVVLGDGTRLSADVYRPAGQAAGPVLVSCYPYRKDDVIGSLFEQTRIRLCQRGYASVFADMAGTGASEGDYGESFDLPREGRDLAEVIEWAAGQDWCDGTVGAWGVSYGGMTALAAAAHRPPHLRAIAAVYATADIYRDTIAPGGCQAMLGRYAWAAHMMALGLCPPTAQDPGGRWRRAWSQRLRRLTEAAPHAITWQAHPDRDAYWQARVIDAAAIEVPAMLIGGWADMYKDAMTSLYGTLSGPKRLVMGPWMHVLPHLSCVQPYDWVAEMADWWDIHLRGAARPAPDPVLFFAAGEGWRRSRQWPPDGAGQLLLFPAGHGLDASPPAARTEREYHGDAAVGADAGMWDPFGTGHGWPQEQSGEDARSLAFTSAPLAGPLLIAGRPEAALGLRLLAGGRADIVARLSQVGPDGRSALITAGWHRLDGEPAGPVTIALGAAAVLVPAGARLRLAVACADFPRIWPSPVSPVIAVGSGPDQPSVLRIPVCEPGRRGHEPAAVPAPPPGPDAGWVSEGEPRYQVSRDIAAGELTVSFGARSRLHAPSGADMTLDELFTARVRPARPDGAALTARITVGLRLPAGEQVDVEVHSASTRTATAVQGSVTVDGTVLLRHRWTGQDAGG